MKMCKRIMVLALAFLLCMESSLPVLAAEKDNLMTYTGAQTQTMPEGMQPFDYSEEAIAAAALPNDVFMEQYGLSEEDLAASELEMETAIGGACPVSEEVSADSVSANATEVSSEKVTYATLEDAADYVRSKMVARKKLITIRVAGDKDTALKSVTKIMDEVFAYDINGKPTEGDYLYWHMYAISWPRTLKKNNDGTYTIPLGFQYRTTADEEKFVTQKVNAIISSLNLKSPELTDYQKVRAIYDYIMSIVQYDTFHYEYDQSYNYMYTTYEALNSGFAVCQAYSTLFYRLCEEVGISARVICGNDDASGNPTHGWNIVKIGNCYYNLDATWDDSEAPTHIYFLKNMDEFVGHQRNKVNDGAAFDKEFPMASVSYPTPDSDVTGKMVNVANIAGELDLVSGGAGSVSASAGKAKVIFFVNPGEDGSVIWTEDFFAKESLKSAACDAMVVDIFDGYAEYEAGMPQTIMSTIMRFTSTPNAYQFSSDYIDGLVYRNQYASMVGMPQGSYCSIAVIDGNNQLRYFNYADYALMDLDRVLTEISYTMTYGTVTGMQAVQTQNNIVSISWVPFQGATEYRVYRKMGNGEYSCVGTTAGTTFADEIVSKYTYTYKVCALYKTKEIASSAEVPVATRIILLKKGKIYTVDGYRYKVLKSTNSQKTVAFSGLSDKKLVKVLIPDTVTIEGLKYKVTEVSANALKGNKKVKTVSVGANVTKIGKQAFFKASKLTNIVVKTKNLKSVGKKALSGIAKKAEIRVPASKFSKYKKLFSGKGQKSSVKIKK